MAGLAAPLAIAATRRRTDVALAAALTILVVLGGTAGWYAYLTGVLCWTAIVAMGLLRTPRPTADRRA